MPRQSKADQEKARLCRFPGCDRPWQTTFRSRIGPVCFAHQPTEKSEPLPSIPTTPPAKSWADPERDD